MTSAEPPSHLRRVLRLSLLSVLVALSSLLCGCQLGAYDVKVEYECSSFNTTYKACMKWKQTGELSPSTQCLPGHALLQSRAGLKRLDEIQLGDEVLGFNHATGLPEYSKVRAWLHRHPKGSVEMLDIKTEAGTLTASSYHSVAVLNGKGVDYAFTRDIRSGDRIAALNGSAEVLRSDPSRSLGFYAPLTQTSNFYVTVGTSELQLLVHSFAHLRDPRKYDVALHAILDVVEFFSPSIHTVSDMANAYAHPVVRFLAWATGLPLDPASPITWSDGNSKGPPTQSSGNVCVADSDSNCAPGLDTPTSMLQVETNVKHQRGSKVDGHLAVEGAAHGNAQDRVKHGEENKDPFIAIGASEQNSDTEFVKILQVTLGTPPFILK